MLVEEQKQKRHWLRFRTQVTGKSLTNQDFFNKTIAELNCISFSILPPSCIYYCYAFQSPKMSTTS